jgi:hypothetical protein
VPFFTLKPINLPRQARDRHEEKVRNEGVFVSAGSLTGSSRRRNL